MVFTATVELWDDIETTTAVDGKLGWVLPYIKQAVGFRLLYFKINFHLFLYIFSFILLKII